MSDSRRPSLPCLVNSGHLSVDSIRTLLDSLASDGFGLWEDPGPSRSSCLLSPTRTLGEVANEVWEVVERAGLTNNSILTLYELNQGDVSRGTSLPSVPEAIMLAAVRVLESRGKCAIIPAPVISETGVKFLG